MNINKPLRIGLLLLLVFIAIETIGNLFFEIRDKDFYSFMIYFELFSFLTIAAILIFGLYRRQNGWKWLFILPLALFTIMYCFGTFYFPFPNEITVKEDTEVLYENRDNKNKKIVIQVYWTGFTSSNYHSDTLVVNNFSPWLRTARPVKTSTIDNAWIKKVSKNERK